jgi:hypothetical protein
LTQLEQVRWVLGNLLESKDLPSLWPIRIMLTGKHGQSPTSEFVWQNSEYLLVAPPGSKIPLGEVAGLLLDSHTPRLPAEVESGIRQLFSTLQAHGSRVTWGTAPDHPDLAWARMQLFATKFEYGASFHIFLTALRGGSTMAAAERNALGRSTDEVEKEAQANLAKGSWQAVAVSGRPLDPKRDFGEHSIDPAVAAVYLADSTVASNPKASEPAYKAAVEAGGPAAALGYEGLGTVAKLTGEDPGLSWDNAIRAGSRSAAVYVAAAKDLPAADALPLLKRAAKLNERWGEPVFFQVQFAGTSAEKESLLKDGLKLDPRNTGKWIELAQLQTVSGEGTAAQGSWLRAEDSAPSDTERDRVHQLRMSYEQQRLDAAEEARRRERDAAHVADQQAQQTEAERIHAAERKANEALDQASGSERPSNAVEWNSLVREKKLSGSLTRVDCLKSGWRLWVSDRSGQQTELFLPKSSDARLSCGALSRPRKISLQYRASPDDDLHTAGEISSLQIQ